MTTRRSTDKPANPLARPVWAVAAAAMLAGILLAATQSFGASSGADSPPEPPPSGGSPPPSPWVPYGYAIPGDPVYGFGIPSQQGRNFLGLAAKGNVVIGDYTAGDALGNLFQSDVVPLLRARQTDGSGNPISTVQPYVVDSSDAVLGYDNSANPMGDCGAASNCFDGNYDQQDQMMGPGPDGIPGNGDDAPVPGLKADGSPRKFYESSLSNADFQQYINPADLLLTGGGTIDAVLYTNHALAGRVPGLDLHGSLVARDEAVVAGGSLTISHDIRLLDDQEIMLTLPFSLRRPRLVTWQECPGGVCPP